MENYVKKYGYKCANLKFFVNFAASEFAILDSSSQHQEWLNY